MNQPVLIMNCLLKDKGPELTALGLPWFPVNHQKLPVESWKAFQRRRPTEAEVQRWQRRFPYALCGIATGHHSIIVIDADSQRASRWLWERGMPRTIATETRKGVHYWFRPPSFEVRDSAGLIAEHVDIRANGGYAIAWPWLKGYSPCDVKLAEMPTWLVKVLKAKATKPPVVAAPARPFSGAVSPYARREFDAGINKLLDAQNGYRNDCLSRVSTHFGSLIAAGYLDEADVVKSVLAVVVHWDKEPLEKSRSTLTRQIAFGKLSPSA